MTELAMASGLSPSLIRIGAGLFHDPGRAGGTLEIPHEDATEVVADPGSVDEPPNAATTTH